MGKKTIITKIYNNFKIIIKNDNYNNLRDLEHLFYNYSYQLSVKLITGDELQKIGEDKGC